MVILIAIVVREKQKQVPVWKKAKLIYFSPI